MQQRSLANTIQVLPGTDLADAWDRFEVFEALHHSLQICNPMSSAELDEVLSAIDLVDGQHVLDSGCGSGEVLVRAGLRAQIVGTGIDLSPWMISRAHEQATLRAPQADLTWVVGEARDFKTEHSVDVCVCIGAEWVWHDFAGTARALSQRLDGGGVAVIGAARLHLDADQHEIAATHGRVETVDDMHAMLDAHGFVLEHRVDPDDAGWDLYLDRTAEAAAEWATLYPGERADKWIQEQADWQLARDRDRDVIGWSVWVARKR